MKNTVIMMAGRWGGIVGAVLAAAASSRALAEISGIAARVDAAVEERIGEETGSTSNTLDELGLTADTFPLEALAALGLFTEGTAGDHGAQAVARMTDPRDAASANPAEFALETASYSADDQVSYVVEAKAAETRNIVLTADDLGVEASGEANEVISTFFLSGAIVVWSDDPNADLTGLTADFEVTIAQQVGTNGPENVFSIGVRLDGGADGTLQLTQSDAVQSVFGGPEVLNEVGGNSGAVGDLLSVGQVHVLLIEGLNLEYRYPAEADVAFSLQADVRLRARNLPAGTGVAGAFGKPLTGLATTLGLSLAPTAAARVQTAVNQAFEAGREDATTQPATSPLGACGLLGVETGALMALGVAWTGGKTARRLARRPARRPIDVTSCL